MNSRKAFTTMELLLATALSAVLMVGVLRVVQSIDPRSSARRHAGWPTQPWAGRFIELMRNDLSHARAVWKNNTTVTMIGYSATQPAGVGWPGDTGPARVHEPVMVQYRLWSGAGGNWLLRRQMHLGRQTNRNAWSEVVARGILSLELSAADRMPASIGPDVQAWPDQPGPVPDRVGLALRPVRAKDRGIDTVIVLR